MFCAVVLWKYWEAVRTYIQRDDGSSNLGWERTKKVGEDTAAEEGGVRR